jgi:hypothetical protein
VQRALRSLHEQLREEAFFVDWPVESLDVGAELSVSLPDGVLAEVDEDLAAILEGRIPDGPGRSAAAAPREVVQEARALLRRLIAEVQR